MSLQISALVPVKGFAQAKRRLGLPPAQRAALAREMAGHVLGLLRAHPRLAVVAVVSADSQVLEWAAEHGAAPIRQTASGLNAALEQGRLEAPLQAADVLLIVPADLPFLCADDVSRLADEAGKAEVIIVPAERDGGTNALLLQPPTAMSLAFGPNSAQRHLAVATQLGLTVTMLRLPSLARDIDEPDDLLLLDNGTDFDTAGMMLWQQ